MNSIGDFAEKDLSKQFIKESLKIGQIIHVYSRHVSPPKNKFCIIINIDPLIVLYINSEVSKIYNNDQEKLKLQIVISKLFYDFLEKDSIVDCVYWEFKMNIDDVAQQIFERKPYYDIRCELCATLKQKIVVSVTNSRFLPVIRKAIIAENLK
jgi:hypothetical protein